MNRIDKKLASLKKENQKILSPYLTAGDPSIEATVPLMHALVRAGADILELGLPFSDPMTEGSVIQSAMERALANGVDCDIVFSMIAKFREEDKDTPIVLMGYLNPIEIYGFKNFAEAATFSGADGIIVVDLPPEESEKIDKIWASFDFYGIYLCSPTTSPKRMNLISERAKGYLYYVSLKGVTGSNLDMSTLEREYLQRKESTTVPLMVGFGIKSPEMASKIAKFADGVIVGAALISKIIAAYNANQDIYSEGASLISNMRQAINNV